MAWVCRATEDIVLAAESKKNLVTCYVALNAMLDAERVAMNVMRIMHCRSEQSVQLPCRKLSNTLTRAIIWALVQPRHTNSKKHCESTSKNRVSKRLIYVHYPNMCRSTGVDKHITQAVSSA